MTYEYAQVVGIVEMADIFFAVVCMTAFAYDLTLDSPPDHDHEVDQATLLPESPFTVVHWLPVPEDEPQRLLYTTAALRISSSPF